MAKLYFVALVWLAAYKVQATDPIEAEITTLENQLFYLPEAEDVFEVSVNETLEHLTRLESLAAQRADRHEQLLTDLRELISFSEINDEKCRAGEPLGIMLNYHAYNDIAYKIRYYWSYQTSRQLEHCLMKLNQALDGEGRALSVAMFERLIERVKVSGDDAVVVATRDYLASRERGGFALSEAEFNSLFDEYVKSPCDGVMELIEPWTGIVRELRSVYLHGVRVEDRRADLMAWGVPFCQRVSSLKDAVTELYKESKKELRHLESSSTAR